MMALLLLLLVLLCLLLPVHTRMQLDEMQLPC